MNQSPRLGLSYLAANQAQKHVTLNESLRRLDALVLASAASATLPAPAMPVEGDTYIVPAGAGGVWASASEGDLAVWQDGAWTFISPLAGWACYVVDSGETFRFDGASWSRQVRLGINAAPDDINRFAIASAASLFNHEGDDHRLTINKDTSANTASVLLQSGYSGRAEIGLCGDDDLHFKVSDDGFTFTDALSISADTGTLTVASELELPDGVVIRNTGRAATSGVEIIGGGGLGPVSMKIVNDAGLGVAGALFKQNSPFADIDLVDFAFETQTQKMNLRVESRAAFVGSGGTPEFQIFENTGGGDNYVLRASPHSIVFEKPARLAAFPVAGLPSAASLGPGAMVFVSDASGGSEPAFSDGTDWRLFSSRAIVS